MSWRRRRGTRKLRFESLQQRKMLAADIGLTEGVLCINGGEGDESVETWLDGDQVVVSQFSMNADGSAEVAQQSVAASDVQSIMFNGRGGNDVFVNGTQLPSLALGGAGDDTLVGGSARDVLVGEQGNDLLYGREGNDVLLGGAGVNALLQGETETPASDLASDSADQADADASSPETDIPPHGETDPVSDSVEDSDTGLADDGAADDAAADDAAAGPIGEEPSSDASEVPGDDAGETPASDAGDSDVTVDAGTDTATDPPTDSVIPETDAGPGEDETVVEGDSTSGDDVCGGTNTPAPVGDQTDGESPANLDLSVGYDDADGTDDLANELPAGDSAPASETAVPETTEVVDDVPVGTVAESDNDRIFGGAGSDWIFGQAGDDILFGDDLDDVLTTDFLADLLLGAVSIA